MPVLDLTHPISSGMQVYPQDPQVLLQPALQQTTDGVAVTAVHCGSHTGTHLDAPSHVIAAGRSTSQIDLDELCAQAVVIQVGQARPREVLGRERLGGQIPESVPSIVVIATGWDRHYGTDSYLEHPVLEPALVQLLIERGMRVLAVDTLNPDHTRQEEHATGFPVHELVLGSDRLIVENLRGATGLPDSCRIGFFPLNLESCDGAPVRAAAWVE